MICKKRDGSIHTVDELAAKRDLDDYRKDYHMKNLPETCAFIRRTASGDVTIAADYDVDGIMSCYITYRVYRYLGAKPRVRFLRRLSEGFGLKESVVDEVACGTLVTVDNGTTAIEAVRKAKAKGLMVGIIDHHMPVKEGELPDADVILNPHAVYDSGDFQEYCATGLALRVAEEIVKDETLLRVLLVHAAIATIADVVPLVEDNRRIVVDGLGLLNDGYMTPSLQALIRVFDLVPGNITEKDCGFSLVPAMNASGRMIDDGAAGVFKFLTMKDCSLQEVMQGAQRLYAVNEVRKSAVKRAVKRAKEIISDNGWEGTFPLVLYDETFMEGIVGIIAGRIAEAYHVPSFCLAPSLDDAIAKGSARTGGGIDLKQMLDAVADDLVTYGGHTGAAGLSLRKDMLEKFRKDASAVIAKKGLDVQSCIEYDLDIAFGQVNNSLVDSIRSHAPYGNGNPEPVFKVSGIRFVPCGGKYYAYMGDEDEHFRMFAENGIKVVGFNIAEKLSEMGIDIVRARDFNYMADCICHIDRNYYRGEASIQLEVLDIEFREIPKKRTSAYMDLKSMLVFG